MRISVKRVVPCFLLCLCTGCTATQVRDRAYYQTMELQSPLSPTVFLHDFQEEGTFVQGSGTTVSEAISNTAISVGKAPFLGHLELIAYQNPAYGSQLETLRNTYRLSPSCKVLYLSNGQTLVHEKCGSQSEKLKQAEQTGNLPETNLFTILREWSSSSGTALIPQWNGESFSVVIATKDSVTEPLSQDAAIGLCWLRGGNYPQQIFLSDSDSYIVTSARTQWNAQVTSTDIHITATVYLQGTGNFDAASEEIFRTCDAAVTETVTAQQADVFDLEACLWSQCYDTMEQNDWHEIISNISFTIRVKSIC